MRLLDLRECPRLIQLDNQHILSRTGLELELTLSNCQCAQNVIDHSRLTHAAIQKPAQGRVNSRSIPKQGRLYDV